MKRKGIIGLFIWLVGMLIMIYPWFLFDLGAIYYLFWLEGLILGVLGIKIWKNEERG